MCYEQCTKLFFMDNYGSIGNYQEVFFFLSFLISEYLQASTHMVIKELETHMITDRGGATFIMSF